MLTEGTGWQNFKEGKESQILKPWSFFPCIKGEIKADLHDPRDTIGGWLLMIEWTAGDTQLITYFSRLPDRWLGCEGNTVIRFAPGLETSTQPCLCDWEGQRCVAWCQHTTWHADVMHSRHAPCLCHAEQGQWGVWRGQNPQDPLGKPEATDLAPGLHVPNLCSAKIQTP